MRAKATVAGESVARLSVSRLDQEAVESIRAIHPNEVFARLPGIWITENSGQEHLSAIRSGVLTGPGACGSILLLENGVPVRPTGFCNVNGLFELNTEQAYALEVVRGSASSRFGGNALHGAINAITLDPKSNSSLELDHGAYGYARMQSTFGLNPATVQVHASTTGGYRDDTGWGLIKSNMALSTNHGQWLANHTLAIVDLAQETGGYIGGERAYQDDELRRQNPNPEAFRDAFATRLVSHWNRDELYVIPFYRQSHMAFLQHFLPGQPLEKNAQQSGGLIVSRDHDWGDGLWSVGAMVEYMAASLQQSQTAPTRGSAFVVATRPVGTHYDYDVHSTSVAFFHNLIWPFGDGFNLDHSARLERLEYEYDNRHLDGNTRDDGSTCGFGGCIYTRPADRQDQFTNFAWSVGIQRAIHGSYTLDSRVSAAFRPPQVSEMYRLQSGQTLADLDSETLNSVEIAVRKHTTDAVWSVVLYHERKRDAILRDAEGFNINGGKTRATGLELELVFHIDSQHEIGFAGSYADHVYDFTRRVSRGEMIEAGNQVDSAPKLLGNARWRYSPRHDWSSELELKVVGEHYLNAANTARYEGHQILNWRVRWDPMDAWQIHARLMNVTDEQYATRADFAFGSYRYFPARPRHAYVGVKRTW